MAALVLTAGCMNEQPSAPPPSAPPPASNGAPNNQAQDQQSNICARNPVTGKVNPLCSPAQTVQDLGTPSVDTQPIIPKIPQLN